MMTFWNRLLDKSIYFSFDKTGFSRHKKTFSQTPLSFNKDQESGSYLITGASRGIGQAVAKTLKQHHQHVITLARGNADIKANLGQWDKLLSSLEHYFSSHPGVKIKGLILNAGAMPSNATFLDHGYELQFSSQLVGHFLLFSWIIEHNKMTSDCRTIWITSGGMLLKKLDLKTLFYNNKINKDTLSYDKVSTYANVKRAQAIVVEELSHINTHNFIACMHPGWVSTQAVQESLPKFYQWMKDRLRDTDEGADTILWLLSDQFSKDNNLSGKLWFDRNYQTPYPLPLLKESIDDRNKLMTKLFEFARKYHLTQVQNKI